VTDKIVTALIALSIAGLMGMAAYGQDIKPKTRFVLGDRVKFASGCISQIGCFIEDVEYRFTDEQGWYVVVGQGITLNAAGEPVSTPEVWTINPASLYGFRRLPDATLAVKH